MTASGVIPMLRWGALCLPARDRIFAASRGGRLGPQTAAGLAASGERWGPTRQGTAGRAQGCVPLPAPAGAWVGARARWC